MVFYIVVVIVKEGGVGKYFIRSYMVGDIYDFDDELRGMDLGVRYYVLCFIIFKIFIRC